MTPIWPSMWTRPGNCLRNSWLPKRTSGVMDFKPVRVRSQEAFQRACRVIPGGVNSPARAFGAVGGDPLFIARGEGPCLYDLDGNQYLDYIGSWGPLILGHAHPRVVRAVEDAVRRGLSCGAPTEQAA